MSTAPYPTLAGAVHASRPLRRPTQPNRTHAHAAPKTHLELHDSLADHREQPRRQREQLRRELSVSTAHRRQPSAAAAGSMRAAPGPSQAARAPATTCLRAGALRPAASLAVGGASGFRNRTRSRPRAPATRRTRTRTAASELKSTRRRTARRSAHWHTLAAQGRDAKCPVCSVGGRWQWAPWA